MVEPPDLERPFAGDSERAVTLAELLRACVELEKWINLSADPARLTPEQKGSINTSANSNVSPEQGLQRWETVFDDELRAVIDARNRAIHGIRLGDAELRGASWLARGLLALLTSVEPG
jgi:hypothetical protein